jgi:hypothetical protein
MPVFAAIRLALASILLFCCAAEAQSADYFTGDDKGGNLEMYWNKFAAVRKSGQRVVINGKCLSACTMSVVVMPRDRICVTNKARLGFHAAIRSGRADTEGTKLLYSTYPADIQKWITENHALDTLKFTVLSGRELESMIPRCPEPLYSGRMITSSANDRGR